MIVNPNNSIPITNEDGLMQNQFRLWVFAVTKLSIKTGTGSPEGVVEGDQTQEYMDITGTAGDIKYIKRDSDIAGDKTKGWILI